MARKVKERFKCESCGAQLIYEVECPCPGEEGHQELCCGKQMKALGVAE